MTLASTWVTGLFAEGIVEQSVQIMKWLAVGVGAIGGGLLAGAAGKGAMRFLVSRPLPVGGLLGCRLGGAVAVGLLVYFLFPTGFGGKGDGTGAGDRSGNQDSATVKPSPPKEDPKKSEPFTLDPGVPLRIEVLGPDALKVLKKADVSPPPCYRIERDEKQRLYDPEGLRGELPKWHTKNPSLRVILLLYKDSPTRGLPLVASLEDWLKEREIKVDVTDVDDYSPEVKRNPK